MSDTCEIGNQAIMSHQYNSHHVRWGECCLGKILYFVIWAACAIYLEMLGPTLDYQVRFSRESIACFYLFHLLQLINQFIHKIFACIG